MLNYSLVVNLGMSRAWMFCLRFITEMENIKSKC